MGGKLNRELSLMGYCSIVSGSRYQVLGFASCWHSMDSGNYDTFLQLEQRVTSLQMSTGVSRPHLWTTKLQCGNSPPTHQMDQKEIMSQGR